MGCDFYTYYVVRIEYKNGEEIKTEKKVIQETIEKHYLWELRERDEDFEELREYYERIRFERQLQVDNELRHYPRKDLYKDGKWLCIESSQGKYKNLCQERSIAEDDLIAIWKEGNYHFR